MYLYKHHFSVQINGTQDGSFDIYSDYDCAEVWERKKIILEYEPAWNNVKRHCPFRFGVSKELAVHRVRQKKSLKVTLLEYHCDTLLINRGIVSWP